MTKTRSDKRRGDDLDAMVFQAGARGASPSLDSTAQFLDEIGDFQPFDRATERDLSAKIQAGLRAQEALKEIQARYDDPQVTAKEMADLAGQEVRLRGDERVGRDALDKLVTHNLKFAVTLAKNYQNRGFALGDLISVANEGMLHAATKFNGEKGVPFIAYAAWWIRQRLLSYVVVNGSAVQIPRYRQGEFGKISRITNKLMQILGRYPTAEEVAEESGYDLAVVEEIVGLIQPSLELDASVKGEGSQAELSNYFGESREEASDPEEVMVSQIAYQSEIEKALGVLTEREQKVICMYFGLRGEKEHDLPAIGRHFGFTPERARQIRAKALGKIRDEAGIRDLREDG